MIGPQDRVTVVGAGIAGVSTAAALRRRGHSGPLVLLDAGAVPHDRPPLSKAYLSGRTGEDGVRLYPPEWFVEHDVDVRTGLRARSLDPATGTVVLPDGSSLVAEAVVLAQGAAARPPQVPGAGLGLPLRTLDDARRLRALLRPGARLVVLGAGLVGSEVAATATSLGVHVTLVDPDPLPLAAAVGEDVARVLHADHGRHGVRVVQDQVDSLAAVPGGTAVRLGGGEVLPADVVLLATGMRCVDDLARGAGLEVADGPGGVVVDERQRTSAAGVLAVGDGTRRRRPDGSPAAPAGHWDAARLDGDAAAATLLGQDAPPRGAAWFWSDRHGRHVEAVGDVRAGTRTLVRGTPGPDPFSVLAWADGVLVGAVSVDDVRTGRAARRLVDRQVPVDPDLLGNPATDLRVLLRG